MWATNTIKRYTTFQPLICKLCSADNTCSEFPRTHSWADSIVSSKAPETWQGRGGRPNLVEVWGGNGSRSRNPAGLLSVTVQVNTGHFITHTLHGAPEGGSLPRMGTDKQAQGGSKTWKPEWRKPWPSRHGFLPLGFLYFLACMPPPMGDSPVCCLPSSLPPVTVLPFSKPTSPSRPKEFANLII